MIRLDGQRVVITGAGGGVGSALTRAFTDAGAQVVACDLASADIPAQYEAHRFDLRDQAAVAKAAGDILTHGAVDVLVCNAGWTRAELLTDVTPAALTDEMDRNFTGAALLCQGLLPAMRARGSGAIVFISSVNALSHHGNPAYSAAKAALLAWMRAIAVEEGKHGIRANAVIPASIRTNAWDHRLQADPALLDRLAAMYPLGRIVTTEEVANAVLFLASPLASGITGTSLTVDAGLMAGNLPFLAAIN
ncbi:MAG: SDR family oxidoreductase [Candidatus Saccharibacteria bacterium]|nr:SDR family oxidoreductase [Pseudorhodobacter sp.]